MKRFHISFAGRIAVIVIIAAAVCAVNFLRGAYPSEGSSPLLSEEAILSTDVPYVFSIGYTAEDNIAGIIGANGGREQSGSSIFAKKKIPVKIEKFANRSSLHRAFVKGRINVIASNPAHFAEISKSLGKLNPAAFMLCGQDFSKPAIFAKNSVTSGSNFAGKKIACSASSSSLYFARAVADASNSSGQSKWIYTVNDAETLSLFGKGKADIIAVDCAAVKTPAGMIPSVSSDDTRSALSTVLITREADLVLNYELYISFVSSFFEFRKSLASAKEPDAIAIMSSFGIICPEAKHPVRLLATEYDNLLFFRLTAQRGWDYFLQYSLGLPEGKNDPVQSAASTSTMILASLYPGDEVKPEQPSSESDSQRKIPFTVISNSISFSADGTEIEKRDRPALTIFRPYSLLFPSSQIQICLGGDTAAERTQFYQRENSLRNFLTQQTGIPASRISVVKGASAYTSLVLIPKVK